MNSHFSSSQFILSVYNADTAIAIITMTQERIESNKRHHEYQDRLTKLWYRIEI